MVEWKHAVRKGDLNKIMLLVDKGIDVNIKEDRVCIYMHL